MMKRHKYLAGAALLATGTIVSSPAWANNTTFYVNNQAGSNCSDAGAGTQAQPWCTLAKVNAHGAYGPGDSILLARGATWNEQLDLTGTGTSTAWITLGAYGSGNNPKIIRSQSNHEMAVRVTNPDYWAIEHLEVGKAAQGILIYFDTKGHQGLRFTDIFAHDIKGIAGSNTTDYPLQGGVADPWAIANHVNESAGILVTSQVWVNLNNSSEYIIKDIKASAIRGNHNNNTLSFNAFGLTPDGLRQSGFQDLDVDRLDIDTDDGHAGANYQAAGLGCANALSLVGITRARVHDSNLYQGAACHTNNGTAQVFTGMVENLTLVNNTFVYTPPTSSNDMTAIDYEYWEKNMKVTNNFVAGNAGPGIEILNIHGSNNPGDLPDFVTTVMDGNTFSVNNIYRPSGINEASIHQGGHTTTSTATLSNNLYTEPNRPFFGGEQTGGITQVNNKSLPSTANYAAAQFSNVQGNNQWTYRYVANGAFYNLPNYAGDSRSTRMWYNGSRQFIGGSQMSAIVGGGVARVWTAPYAGTVSIRGRVLKADVGNGVSAGNGIAAAIVKISGNTASQIWPTNGNVAIIGGTDGVGLATALDNVSVAAGDQLYFDVDTNGNDDSYDTASWSPSVGYTASSTTPYSWTFATPMNYEGWNGASQIAASVTDGAMVLTSYGNDPYLYSQDNLNSPASAKYIHLRLKNTSSDGGAAIYFTTTSVLGGSFDGTKVKAFTTATNATGYTDYVVDMSTVSGWTGTIKQLRFDPIGAPGTVYVDAIWISSN